MRRSRLLRLGLFQIAAGSTSVIFLGVVNRVLRVELGMDLQVVSLLVGGGHYLGALVAIPFGHYSDRHPLAGYRRTPYALAGVLLTASLLAITPYVVVWLAQHPEPTGRLLGFGFFLVEGISTYVAGTAYLGLLADLTGEKDRGPASAMAWTMLMVGIILTGIGTGRILDTYSFEAFRALTFTGASVAVAAAMLALIGQEPRASARPAVAAADTDLRSALALLGRSTQARWFAGFLLLAMLSFFMHDVILEPFGGEVFRLTPGQTTRFNAFLGAGVIPGMLLGGLGLIPRFGKVPITTLGCLLMGASFGLLALISLNGQSAWLSATIALLGLGSGLFTVGGVALMMDMTAGAHTGLFAGAWTLMQAASRGVASVAGGALQATLVAGGATAAQGYAGVFALEGLGVLLAIYFLAHVGVRAFRREVTTFSQVAAQALD